MEGFAERHMEGCAEDSAERQMEGCGEDAWRLCGQHAEGHRWCVEGCGWDM